jgi:hypothetical protein
MIHSHSHAGVGDVAVQPRRFEPRDGDYTGVIVVASAWLLFYCVALGGYALKQGFEVLASLY